MLDWRRSQDNAWDVYSRPSGRGNNRLALLIVVTFLWALAILCRLIFLQVVSHREYREAAERQQQRTLTLEAPRGTIFDRSGRPLAMSVPVDSVCINPLRVSDRPMAAEILSGVLGVDRQELLDKMERAVESYRKLGRGAPGSGFLWVKRKISAQESERLRSLKLDWVEFRKETQRYYPDGTLASHLLGSVDFQERGNLGLEQSLDKELRGRPGRVRMVTDVQHRGVAPLSTSDPDPGVSVTLTVDERIQFVVERELAAACRKYRATSGSIVVMNPGNGEVLAMASYPTFDPGEPPEPAADPSVRFNHPVSVPFEPGSVFKIITLSAGLETTSLTPETPIHCGNGRIKLGGRVIREAKRGFGTLSATEVLAKSSNVGAIQVALRVGEKNMLEYVRRFGFGRKAGVRLPAESGGVVRDLKRWGKTSLASIAMGHEISTTTLQLARACSAIANGGLLVRPRLLLSRQRPGEPAEPVASEPPHRILRPATAQQMRLMMEQVVLNGTGRAARLKGYTSAGKTGSAQIFDFATRRYTHEYNGSFVGFAPLNNPAIVVAVTLNGVKLFGGVVAAPVFRAVAQETLRLLDVPRDLPDVEPQPADPAESDDLAIAGLSEEPPEDLEAPAIPPEPAGAEGAQIMTIALQTNLPRVPSFHGKTLRAVLEESVALGLPVDVIGSGVAREQFPAAGDFLPAGDRVRVSFR